MLPMQLTSLVTRNFRNLAALDLEIPPEGVVILGENGHGKTNVLEALYYLVLFRSVRGAKDRDLVRFGTDGFFVSGTTDHHVTAGYEVQGRRKKVTVDGVESRKLADAVGRISAVMFSPADRDLVSGGPSVRRRFMDILLSLSSPGYLRALGQLRNALKQRNTALRRGNGVEASAFDAPLAEASGLVASARRRWGECWHERFTELNHQLGEPLNATMEYRAYHHREHDQAEVFCRELAVALDRDLQRGMTTVGPHRDDLNLTLANHELRRFGSAGQQRTAAVALRIVEAASLAEATRTAPIALYDDVFAELDAQRQANLLSLIQGVLPGQAILTAPRVSEIPEALLDRPRWAISKGQLATTTA